MNRHTVVFTNVYLQTLDQERMRLIRRAGTSQGGTNETGMTDNA
ncbi:hypothetical protein RMSM_04626 [Rhodopirellula maiorica SM1]|uniref:Uncharacterized protein n=1 Tax=Rhodopirellula maiorica SM1 TaxID=1265738 RepID=M5RH21_9BACT|nr:hypothetical protein [Rhodopirellula maiorica]EMI18451.1 hypothetical protein RMSM_04626 [Rhodopirellula maiorica SM1]